MFCTAARQNSGGGSLAPPLRRRVSLAQIRAFPRIAAFERAAVIRIETLLLLCRRHDRGGSRSGWARHLRIVLDSGRSRKPCGLVVLVLVSPSAKPFSEPHRQPFPIEKKTTDQTVLLIFLVRSRDYRALRCSKLPTHENVNAFTQSAAFCHMSSIRATRGARPGWARAHAEDASARKVLRHGRRWKAQRVRPERAASAR